MDISLEHGWWVAPQPYPGPRWPPPIGIAATARQAASGYALRALPQRRTYTTCRGINVGDGDDQIWRRVEQDLLMFVSRRLRCFLSYSRLDAVLASRLAFDLRTQGREVWRDEDCISPGALWDREIEAAIRGATHVLYLVSVHSVASRTVADELSLAQDCNKIVVPCIFQQVELPMRVRRNQSIDFSSDYESALRALLWQLTEWPSRRVTPHRAIP